MGLFSRRRQSFQVLFLTIATIVSAAEDHHISYGRDLEKIADGIVFGQETEYEVQLDPFQLYLQYDDNDSMSSTDEMMVLTTTQDYLSKMLETRTLSFSRLALFQFVRDYPESQHYAKVAIGGTAFFFEQNMEPSEVQTEIYLNFVGENMITFVTALRDAGMTHIVNATLMSVDGSEMEYRDGEMVGVGGSADSSEYTDSDSEREMSGDMRMMTILLSLCIPGAVLCLACTVFACRSVREIRWKTPKTTPEAPVWQSSEHCRVSEASRKFELKNIKKSEEEKMEED
jgi:predicted RNA-binding protein with PUA-like domain